MPAPLSLPSPSPRDWHPFLNSSKVVSGDSLCTDPASLRVMSASLPSLGRTFTQLPSEHWLCQPHTRHQGSRISSTQKRGQIITKEAEPPSKHGKG